MGMGNKMGKAEVDDRGRLTLPSAIRKKLNIKPGDKLSVSVSSGEIILRKKPPKDEIMEKLAGCIRIPTKDKITPESIKGIWKEKA